MRGTVQYMVYCPKVLSFKKWIWEKNVQLATVNFCFAGYGLVVPTPDRINMLRIT